jgi:uncharacterized protein YyaL (SSP411 family)
VAALGSVVGDHPTVADDPARGALVREVRGRLLPCAVSVVAPPGVGAELTPLLADRDLVDGKPAAYVCERFACRRPVTEPAVLAALLEELQRQLPKC